MRTRGDPRSTVPPRISIRPATTADIDVLAALYRRYQAEVRCFTQDEEHPSFDDCRRHIRRAVRGADRTILVVADGSDVLGFCALRIMVRQAHLPSGWVQRISEQIRRGVRNMAVRKWLGVQPPAPDTRRIAFMDDIYVLPDARSRGVALPLIRASFAWGRAQGTEFMEGATWADNTVMLRLAEHLDIDVVRVLLRKRLS